MSGELLYIVGLILVILYICTGIDDFIWDIITLWNRRKQKNKTLMFTDLEGTPPKLIAMVIAAWHEDSVLLDVVENIIVSQQYPKSMYHIFLGVYPNDASTVYIAQQLQNKHFNVHCVVNYMDGPTSKAQNINFVISKIKEYEAKKNWKFSAITVHDSEDLVHPYELKVTNYLMDTYPAIQFPVFPLIKKPTVANFFANLTTNTYADEFAENHFITMVSRRNTGAFVPSAGTGFSLARETIDVLGYNVLPENSLTEDYRLSLTLYENGLQMHYVLEKLERLNFQGKKQDEFIATRSMFPNTFNTAVKQKTRWTLGITMQSLKFKDVFNKNLSFVGKYSLYRDQKAKIGNLLSMVGYPVLIYFIASLFIPLTTVYPKYTLSWYLCVVVTIMMIERQVFRAVALKNIYGFRSVFFGCLFPPLVPVRIIWGNIINLVSTIRAYIQFLKGKHKNKKENPSQVTNQADIQQNETNSDLEDIQISINDANSNQKEMMKFEWSKTEHSFLDKEVLLRFHRRFGDVLVAKGYIEMQQLKDLLDTKSDKEFIGSYLINLNIISEEQFLDTLTNVKNIPFIHKDSLSIYNLSSFRNDFSKEFLLEYKILPLLKTKNGYVFAYGSSAPINIQSSLREKFNLDKQTVLALDESIVDGILQIYDQQKHYTDSAIDEALANELITAEQVIIIRNYAINNQTSEMDMANQMGIFQTITDQPEIMA